MRSISALLALVGSTACANVLSYDEYRARADAAPLPDTTVVEDVHVDNLADVGPPPARLPPRPSGAATASGTGKTLWLAARTYSFGMADYAGVESDTAWSTYGYDLDKLCTLERDSRENTTTCLRPAGAPQDSLIDGEGCRDNNFSRYVSAILRTSLPTAESTLNGLVKLGSTTWILRIEDVDLGANDPYAPGFFYRSGDERMTAPPAWDGNDDRSVQSDSLVDGDLSKTVLAFPRGYISGGAWVSGEPAPMKLVVPVTAIASFPISLDHGFITLQLNAERTSGQHGLLGGATPVSEIENIVKPIADFAGVCPGTPLYISMLENAKKMPDVVVLAPDLQRLDRTCDGVSCALGFEVMPIKPVTKIVPPLPPRRNKCVDAG